MGGKRCYKCGFTLPRAQFCSDKSRPDGLNNSCRECMKLRRDRGRGRPSQSLRYRQARRHGLTVEKLDKLLASGCGVCGSTEGRLAIDHDHSCCPRLATGHKLSCGECVRGVLCSEHNLALGKLGDNLEGVMRLVRYLETC